MAEADKFKPGMRVRVRGDDSFSRPTFTGRVVSYEEAMRRQAPGTAAGKWVYVDPDPGDHGKKLQGWGASIIEHIPSGKCGNCEEDVLHNDDYLCRRCRAWL